MWSWSRLPYLGRVEPQPTLPALCGDLNTISAWLALDHFATTTPQSLSQPRSIDTPIDVIALFGNQVVATLTAACQLAQVHPRASLLFSGGFGHSTHFLFENLCASDLAPLVRDGSLAPLMGEAAMCSIVAQRAFSISPSRIAVENQSTNGGENARFSIRMLLREGLAGATVLLIQDPLMQRRSVLTWIHEASAKSPQPEIQAIEVARFGIPFRVLSHAAFVPRVEPGPHGLPQLIAAQSRATWTINRYIGLLLGEVARLHDDENGYGPCGKNFLAHVDIPAEVWASYQRVLASPLREFAAR
jgi:uncharacterized SAM-binding protein YcdF (DUF218 family)